MTIKHIIPQLRTTDMASSIEFYTEKLGFTVEFNYEGFYVGIRAGDHLIHLKLVDEQDPSIPYVDEGGHLHLYFQIDNLRTLADELKTRDVVMIEDVHNTGWNTCEFAIHDDQGHTLYFGEPL